MSDVISRPSLPIAKRVLHSRVRPGHSKNVIYSTYQHVIELYGPMMPVLVAESLRYTPGASSSASVNLNPDIAWAWYVCGCTLLIWHIPSYTDSRLMVMAREMRLPSSDLAHNANLIYIFNVPNQKAPSCIAVSPEGVIRYWETVGHHSTWIDVNANLGGEEVCNVYYLYSLGCLAVTTSGTMIIITPTVVRTTPTVSIKRVSSSQGWFGNIGRKVSTIIFGTSGQSQASESQLVKVLTSIKNNEHYHIFMLAAFTLQSWVIEENTGVCQSIYETNLEPVIRRAFPELVSQELESEINITDIRASEGGSIVALVVSSNPRIYIIVELNGNHMEIPDTATRLCILSKTNTSILEGPEGKPGFLQFHLLPTTALVFNSFLIYAVPLSGGEENEGEPLDLPGGIVHGSIIYKQTPIFFSTTYGFVSITPVDTSCIDVLNTSVVENHSTPKEITEREAKALTTDDFVASLKLAFVHFVRKNISQCYHVLNTEFPMEQTNDVDCIFARTLVKVSLDIINDISPKDFRWGEVKEDTHYVYIALGDKFGGTISLQLDTQLIEKNKAHDIFLQFAKGLSSTMELGAVSRQGVPVRAIHILHEHNEKIIASITMKKLEKKYPNIISNGVAVAAHKMNFMQSHGIMHRDFFYRYVSIVDEGIKAMIDKIVGSAHTKIGSVNFSTDLISTNKVVIQIIGAVLVSRNKQVYSIERTFLPWLSTSSFHDHLLALTNVNYDALCRFGRRLPKYKKVVKNLYVLSNCVLYLSMHYTSRSTFNAMSSAFIQFFVDFNMHDHGRKLAYKYRNFENLVVLSYQLNGESEILSLIETFGQEFCGYLFNFLKSEGRLIDLLNLKLPEPYDALLKEFNKEIPEMDWIYKCKEEQDYVSATHLLIDLSRTDEAAYNEQEIIYCLAKLSALTGKVPEPIVENIDRSLNLLDYQTEIPVDLLLRGGYNPEHLKILSPEEIIDLLTSEQYQENDEPLFINALCVLKYIDDEYDREIYRKSIWSRAFNRDDWEGTTLDFTPNIVEQFIFFRIIKQILSMGLTEITLLIPSTAEVIENPEMDMFTKNSYCTYLLEYGFEQIYELDDDGGSTYRS